MVKSIFWQGVLASFVLWLCAGGVAAQTYKADLNDADWKSVATTPVCSLTHTIPGFGKGIFTRPMGKGDIFYLETLDKIIFPKGEVAIETLPPVWRSDLMSVSLGRVEAVVGKQPIKIDGSLITALISQLQQGVSLAFIAQKNNTTPHSAFTSPGLNTLRVILEAKSFAAAYKHYQVCTGDLPASAGEKTGKDTDVSRMLGYIKRDTNVYGTNISHAVIDKRTGTATETAKMADYVKRDVTIYGVTIAGHSSSRAKEQIFAADIMSADWKPVSNPFVCSLIHTIPGFGKVSFSHKADGEFFYIETQGKIVFPTGTASIDTLPPVWRTSWAPINLGAVDAVAGNQPIILRENNIAPLVSQLLDGTKVMFTSQPLVDKKNTNFSTTDAGVMRVVVEAKNFATAYQHYQQCISELITYNFAQIARTLFNYSEQAKGLSDATKIELAKVARYMKADPKVLGVLVDAHSDHLNALDGLDTSDINEAVSRQQAEWVFDYLVAQGIAAEKITTRWHGDKFPIANNQTPAGRAQNRRVTVRLETEATRREAEANAAARKAAIKAENESSSSSSKSKITPEDIHKMVEGLDLIKQ